MIYKASRAFLSIPSRPRCPDRPAPSGLPSPTALAGVRPAVCLRASHLPLWCPLTTSLNLFSAKNDKSFGSGRRLISAPTLSFFFLQKRSVRCVEDGPVFSSFSLLFFRKTRHFSGFRGSLHARSGYKKASCGRGTAAQGFEWFYIVFCVFFPFPFLRL